MIKTVIVDMDGLLIDSEILSYEMYSNVIGQYGYAWTREQYAAMCCGKTFAQNVKELISTYHLPLREEEVLENLKKEGYEKICHVKLKPGARELISYLKEKGITVVLGTSSNEERTHRPLDPHQLYEEFDHMAFGSEVRYGKPAPDIFLKAAEKAGSLPQQCLVLEDSDAGIVAALSAGMPVICVPDMKKPDPGLEKQCEAICESLFEVCELLKREN